MSSVLKVDAIQNTAGTSGLTIDSSGRISRSVTPYIYLRGSVAGEATAHGTVETYTNWAVEGSALGGMTWNSSNGRITVPVDGIYLIAAKFYLWINNVSSHGVMVQKNGTTFQEYFTDFDGLGDGGRTDHTLCMSEIVKLDANDYISFSCSGDIYGGSNHTNCQMVMIG